MTEPVFLVGRRQGMVDGDQIQQRSRRIEQGIDQGRKHTDRSGHHPGGELSHYQYRGHGNRSIGSGLHQAGAGQSGHFWFLHRF